VSGNIGSGKTTLCEYLGRNLKNATVFYEGFGENPHLSKFYQHMKEKPNEHNPFALPMQLAFLELRLQVERKADSNIFSKSEPMTILRQTNLETPANSSQILISPPSVSVIDRCLYEDHEIFAKNQHRSGMFTNIEYSQYLEIFQTSVNSVLRPDVVVLLDVDIDILLNRIKQRGREMEIGITKKYLEDLQANYRFGLQKYLEDLGVPIIKPHQDLVSKKSPPDEINSRLLTQIKQILNLE
jgi:deoxyadenosine/deoxycytidine kinase